MFVDGLYMDAGASFTNVSTAFIKDMCAFVDGIDPNSPMGRILEKNMYIVDKAVYEIDIEDIMATRNCDSSQTCSVSTKPGSKKDAPQGVWSGAKSLWNSISRVPCKIARHAQLWMEMRQLQNDWDDCTKEFGRKVLQYREKMQAPFSSEFIE